MIVPRFHLYGSPERWHDDIQEHEAGLWVRWKDVQPYLDYCSQVGVVFEPPTLVAKKKDEEPESIIMDEDTLTTIDDDDDYHLDLYELVTGHGNTSDTEPTV